MKWKVIDWLVRILIALAFIAASIGKLTEHPGVLQMFSRFGLPSSFHLLIGVLELAGAILILIPKTRQYAVGILGMVVIGATYMHVAHDPLGELVRPLIYAVLLSIAWYLPRKLQAQ